MPASNATPSYFCASWRFHNNIIFNPLKFAILLEIACFPAMCMAQAPHAPTGLAATASSQQVKLTWVAPTGTPAATGYNLKRSTNQILSREALDNEQRFSEF